MSCKLHASEKKRVEIHEVAPRFCSKRSLNLAKETICEVYLNIKKGYYRYIKILIIHFSNLGHFLLNKISTTLEQLSILSYNSIFNDNSANTILIFKNLKKLELYFDFIGIKNSTITIISQLTNLRDLNLIKNKIGDIGADSISKMLWLTSLNLSCNNTQANGTSTYEISQIPWITILELNINDIDDSGAAEIAKMPLVTNLNFSQNKIEHTAAFHISQI